MHACMHTNPGPHVGSLTENKIRLYIYMHKAITVANAGFVEGGFCNSIVREARVKNLGPCPLLPKNTPIFKRF